MLAFVADIPPILWVLCSQKRQRHSKIKRIGKAEYQNQGKLDSWRPLMTSHHIQGRYGQSSTGQDTAHTLPGMEQLAEISSAGEAAKTDLGPQRRCSTSASVVIREASRIREWENPAQAGQRQKDEKCQKYCHLNHLNIRISWGPFLKDKIQILQLVILIQLIRTNWTLEIYFWQAVKVYLL